MPSHIDESIFATEPELGEAISKQPILSEDYSQEHSGGMHSVENIILKIIKEYHLAAEIDPAEQDILQKILPQYLNGYFQELSGMEFISEELQQLPVSEKTRKILVYLAELISEVNECTKNIPSYVIKTPEEVYQRFFHLKFLRYEVIKVLYLNGRNELIKSKDVANGNHNSASLKPGAIFGMAFELNSNRIIIVHNHPTGRSTPSEDDLKFTRRVKECADILAIQLIDHIIIGDTFYSFRYNDLL